MATGMTPLSEALSKLSNERDEHTSEVLQKLIVKCTSKFSNKKSQDGLWCLNLLQLNWHAKQKGEVGHNATVRNQKWFHHTGSRHGCKYDMTNSPIVLQCFPSTFSECRYFSYFLLTAFPKRREMNSKKYCKWNWSNDITVQNSGTALDYDRTTLN